jgi:hypothetical protein
MAAPAHRRHDISDAIWEKLEPHLPGRQGSWGGIAQDNRLFINAVFWIMRTGAIFRQTSGAGAIRIVALSGGATAASGRDCLKF